MSNVFDRLTARDQDVASADAVNGESDSVQSLDAQGSVDGPHTPFAVKKVVQELLKYGFVEEAMAGTASVSQAPTKKRSPLYSNR
jgi:hypothetical protein